MSTVKRRLPANPHLDLPKQQARELQKQCKARSADAFERVRRRHPRLGQADDDSLSRIKLSDAQWVVAREYAFSSWTQLKQRLTDNTVAQLIDQAIRSSDAERLTGLLTVHPQLLPMSHAANMRRLDMVKLIASLGARDFQHAFDRALLHGDIETAQWLHEHGAELTAGGLMGCCETLNALGFGFLDDAGLPLADEKGNTLAPLAMILETYSRNPSGKHALLDRFRARGYEWADTPIMAFHCGDLDGLKRHFQRDRNLIARRFAYREIYPPELGCHDDGRSGLHGTQIDGTTLLHMAIEFDEQEIFDWLLEQGSDVNAPALTDTKGLAGTAPFLMPWSAWGMPVAASGELT